jgi:hypothetical protein
MRKSPGYHFWRAAILAGGLFLVGLPISAAVGLVVVGVLGYRESGGASDFGALLILIGSILLQAFIYICIIDRRLPRMKKNSQTSSTINTGQEPGK